MYTIHNTYIRTDIATTRKNRPKGRFFENICRKKYTCFFVSVRNSFMDLYILNQILKDVRRI